MPRKTANRSIRSLTHTLLVIAGGIALILGLVPIEAQAQEKAASWDRWDVDISIQKDGSFEVVETHEIGFSGGEFTFGYRNIVLDQVEQITNMEVREGDTVYVENTSQEPNTFYTETKRDELIINWFFPPTTDASRIFTISYTVQGGLLIYDDGDQLYWTAVGANRGIRVRESTVVVRPPEGASVELAESYGASAQLPMIAQDGRSVTFTIDDSISPDDEFEVRVQWPHGYVNAPAPSWQAGWEWRAAIHTVTDDVNQVNLLVGLLSAALIAGGMFMAHRLTRYPRPVYPVGPVPATLNEPPSDLEPGMAGVLLDGQTGIPAIMATVIDLARRGWIEIEETKKGDFTFRQLLSEGQNLKPYEQAVIEAIFTTEPGESALQEVKLEDLKNEFYARTGKIYQQLGEALVEAGLFRSNVNQGGCLYILLSIIFFGAGLASMFLIDNLDIIAHTDLTMVMPCATGGLLAAASLHVMSKLSPRVTREGAEQLTKWQAFKNYLEQIQQFVDLEEAADLFEKYLPYAIAFGIEKGWIEGFARVPQTTQPNWYIPPRAGQAVGSGSAGKSGSAAAPSLDSMSDGMFAGLSGVSAGLFTMLNTTASTFTSQPASSRGGSSGGGFSGGGGFSSGGGGGGGGGGGFG